MLIEETIAMKTTTASVRALLVQDNQNDVEMIRSFCLTSAPYLVFTAVANHADCWAVLAEDNEQTYDVLIVDDLLPDSEGLTLLHELVKAGYPAPVIIVTDRNDVETAVMAMKAGAADYLVKSSNYWEHLPRVIDSAIARYRLIRENQRLHGSIENYASQLEKTAQQAHIEKTRLHTVLDQLPEGVLIVEGPEGRTVACNKAAERIWGRPFVPDILVSEYADLFCFTNMDGSSRHPGDTAIMRALATGHPVMGDQMIIVQPDNNHITVLLNAAPLLDNNGFVIGAVSVFQDISEIKRLEQLKDEVLSIASHELKNPLTVIKGYSSLLSKQRVIQEDARARRITNTISMQSERMQLLVERLLDLSRLDLGRMTLQLSALDLAQLLQNISEQQQATTTTHTLQCNFTLPSLIIIGDYMRLEQVLVNLVGNAIKYSPNGGNIELTLQVMDEEQLPYAACGSRISATGPFAVVEICDQGIGIEPAMQQKLFNRFYRAREAVRLAAGQGLGLYISAEIIRMHGGTLCVESTPKHGSTFRMILPLKGKEPTRTRGK